MSDTACPNCGQPMQGDDCPRCRAATAFAKPEDAEQAKVTPAAGDGAIREGQPPVALTSPEPWPYKHEPRPGGGCGCATYILVGLISLIAIGLLVPAISKVREPAARSETMYNMRHLATACLREQDINKRLPSPKMVVARDGKVHEVPLSWRVTILPFVEQGALHDAFDFGAGWNHEKNVALQEQMPLIFLCPYRNEAESNRMTHFQYFTGPTTLFPDNAARRIQEIPDGSSNTLLFAEARASVIWSQPADMAIRADQPLPLPEDRFFAAMADGSVRMFVRDKIDDTILRQLINPNDQKPDAGWDN